MKKFLLMTMVILISITSNGQDVVVLKHTNYTSHYSKSKLYPVMAEWWITKSKIGCPTPMKRKDNFKPDVLLKEFTNIGPDYVNSGLDRGHMMPAAENLCQTPEIQDECFYFSNMSAQYHSLNAGDWKSLETLERQISMEKDSVRVWCGNVGEIKRVGRVAVPKTCWKVVFVAKTKEYMAYIFENTPDKPSGLNSHKVDLIDIEKLTGLKFK